MTGYGKAEVVCGDKKISVELRAVNSKQLDLSLKLPATYRELEPEVRKALSPLVRGKVDVFVNSESGNAKLTANIDAALFAAYYEQLELLLARTARTKEVPVVPVGEILRLPDVVCSTTSAVSDDEAACFMSCIAAAMQQLQAFRQQEGDTIMADILGRVNLIVELLAQVEPFEKERIASVRARLLQALEESVGAASVDKNRFEQELIYYLEKLDVTEEKTRLRNHCAYFTETANDAAAGKKLGFIAQEMGREINTLGSKANDSNMQRVVVSMKDELEKIKEQLLNVL
jgi:uncharacterized protein (TIGR00255 family)